jgi:hypothetical protein
VTDADLEGKNARFIRPADFANLCASATNVITV